MAADGPEDQSRSKGVLSGQPLNFSAHVFGRILTLTRNHILEAVQYREKAAS